MIEIRLPLKAESTANLREHWAVRAKRTKAQRTAVARRLPPWPGGPLLCVRLTRISPRMLDSGDNLSMSLKGFRDSVASRLKIDDASPLVAWEYHQAKGEAEVVVQIWTAGEEAPSLPVGRLTTKASKRGSIIGKRPYAVRVESSGYDPSRPMGMGHAIQPIMRGGRYRLAQKRLAAGASVHAAYTPPRSVPVDAAQEAEATFTLAPDAPDMTDTLGPGPHPEHYDCPCAPCVGRWNP